MISRKSDVWVGVGILGGIGVLFWETLSIPAPRFEPMGSAMMPKMVLLFMAVLAVVEIVQALVRRNEPTTEEYRMMREAEDRNQPREEKAFRHLVRIRTAMTLGLVVVYVLVLTFGLLNYFVATFIFSTGLTTYLSDWNRRYTCIGMCAIAVILGLLYLLSSTMDLILPTM